MPHLVLEASSNIIETNEKIKTILQECQNLLVDKLPTKLSSCKSRLVLHEVFVLGDNHSESAFVHLYVRVLKGRQASLLNATAVGLRDILSNGFAKSLGHLKLGISVEITELSDNYASVSAT